MRLWTLHPRYLDAQGLVALWREALLAQKVLHGATKGYKHHPQLARFRASSDPRAAIATYLVGVLEEAMGRGYAFNASKIASTRLFGRIDETEGQLLYEWLHLQRKLERRDRERHEDCRYESVTSTLYRFYGIIGAIIQVGSLLAAAVFCWLVRGRGSFQLTLAGALGLAVSLGLWAVLVQPVNAEWTQILQTNPSAAPEAYLRLRDRWEYGHVAAFTAWVIGFGCLLLAVLSEIPWGRADEAAA